MVGSRYRWVDGLRRGSFIENVSTVARWPLLAGCCSDMPCNTADFELNYSIVWAASKSRCFVQLCSPGCGDLFSSSRGVRVACGAEL